MKIINNLKKIRIASYVIAIAMLFILSPASEAIGIPRDNLISSSEKLSGLQEEKTITGNVSDESGMSLPGVSIIIKGTTQGTITDVEGNYMITVPEGEVILVFSSVSMVSQEITVGQNSSINVTLLEGLTELDEIVVIGYGSVTRRELTGSIASITEEDFNAGAVTNAMELMQGKIAGLSITKIDGGDPTKGYELALRGATSINGSLEPLVVIDGIPGGTLDAIAPQDIESISILKDGSAAAIYGTRATNGVVLITTKRGQKGRLQVEYGTQVFTERVLNRFEVMDRDQYLEMKQRFEESDNPAQNTIGGSMIDYGADTDWFEEIIRNNISQNHHLSLSGGGDQNSYRLSLDYVNHEGILLNSAKKEYRVTYNMQQSALNDRVHFKVQLGLTDNKHNPVAYDAVRQTIQRNPTEPVYNEDGSLNEFLGAWQYDNPVGILTERQRDNAFSRLFGNFGMDVYLLKSLKFNIVGGMNQFRVLNGSYTPSYAYPSENAGIKGSANRYAEAKATKILESTLEFRQQFGKHQFAILAGYSYEYYVEEGFLAENRNFITDYTTYNNLELGTFLSEGRGEMSSFKNESILAGFFARGAYNYANKYFISASIRHEGSSKFGDNYRWGTFPAISAAWDLAQESFLKDIEVIDFLKLRAGYGITGNQGLNEFYVPLVRYQRDDGFFFYDGKLVNGYIPASNPNPDLRWETKIEYNAGIDWYIFNSRLGGALDVYIRDTRDLLHEYDVPQPPNLYPRTWANVASMRNSGLEISISAIPIKTEKFTWNVTMNFDYRKNEVVSIENDYYTLEYMNIGSIGSPGIQSTTHRMEEGEPVGNIYSYEFIEIDSTGKWVFTDIDTSGTKNTEDRMVVGNGVPDYYLGLTNTFRYVIGKGSLDLTIMLRGMFGHQIINAKRIWHDNPKFLPRNVLVTAMDTELWDAPEFSSYYVEEGNFMKVDNITLGYTLPFPNIDWFDSVRFYVSCNNAWVFTSYSGLDPEVSFKGMEPGHDNRFDYPSTRTFIAGINVKF